MGSQDRRGFQKANEINNKSPEINKYLYAVIVFIQPNQSNTKPTQDVELVPMSWIFEEEKQYFCRYPPESDYNLIEDWTKCCKEPEKSWKSFLVEILSRTKTLEKGERRLKRSYKTKNIESSDGETCHLDSQFPSVLTKAAVKKTFQDIPSMPQNPQKNSGTKKSVRSIRGFNEADDNEQVLVVAEQCDTNLSTGSGTKKSVRSVHGFNDADDKDQVPAVSEQYVTESYLDQKLQELMVSMKANILKAKRSILYDFDAKMNDMKNTIVANIKSAEAANPPTMMLAEARTALGVALPIDDNETFEALNTSLEDIGIKNALVSLYRTLICGEANAKDCIGKIMAATITKNVQLLYSGTGRKINGKGKLNFSETKAYDCLQDAIVAKFGDSAESSRLPGKIGKWLSCAGDREGGRKKRAIQEIRETNSLDP